ncbi:MAG: phosphatidate cytidylyltransferase [Anaerolineales bacterium]
MLKRTLAAFGVLAIGLPALMIGGIPYFLVIAFFVLAATREYLQMFTLIGHQPARALLLAGVFALLLVRNWWPAYAIALYVALIFISMAWHLWRYERGRDHAALDFAISAAGLTYLGWLGAYLLDLRNLPDGAWWVFWVLPSVWLGDTGAYAIGAAYGSHKMSPRLSPKKSWEGFWAGVFTAGLAGAFLAYCYSTWGPLHLSLGQGAVLGLILGLLTPLGDLGESMFKRQASMKDSGNVIPGHGGAFDRIDSWLWGAPIGYFFIIWFIL